MVNPLVQLEDGEIQGTEHLAREHTANTWLGSDLIPAPLSQSGARLGPAVCTGLTSHVMRPMSTLVPPHDAASEAVGSRRHPGRARESPALCLCPSPLLGPCQYPFVSWAADCWFRRFH